MSTVKANQWLNSDGTENYKCRAWVNFNGQNTVSIRASGNVSSITDNGRGLYTVNFTTAMPDINYVVSATGNCWTENNQAYLLIEGQNSMALASGRLTSSIKITCSSCAGLQDGASCNVAIFR